MAYAGTFSRMMLASAAIQFGFSRGYAVGWGTLSLINAGLAQGKGRRGLNWWLLSLLLGPLATLLIVLRPAVREGGSLR